MVRYMVRAIDSRDIMIASVAMVLSLIVLASFSFITDKSIGMMG